MTVLPFGGGMLTHYVMTLVWLQCWPPLFALANAVLTWHAAHVLGGATQLDGSTAHGLTLANASHVARLQADLGCLAGFLTALTPLLAAGLFKGMMGVFMHAANTFAGTNQSLAMSGAAEAVTGNVRLGTTQLNTHQADNVAANHWDTQGTVKDHLFSHQLRTGGEATVALDGTTTLNAHSGLSQLPVGINLGHVQHRVQSQLADTAQSVSVREAIGAHTALGDAFVQLDEAGGQFATHQQWGTSDGINDTSGRTDATRQLNQLVSRFAQEHHLSHAHAARVLGTAYAQGHLSAGWDVGSHLGSKLISLVKPEWTHGLGGFTFGLGGSLGARAEASRSRDTQHSHLTQQAEQFVRDADVQSTVDTAIRQTHEQHTRSGAQRDARTGHSVSDRFETAERLSQDALHHFEQAEQHRQQAQLSEDDALSVHAQLVNPFFDWLRQQPAMRIAGESVASTQHVMDVLQQHPEHAKTFAEDFVRQRAEQMSHAFEQAHPLGDLHARFEANTQAWYAQQQRRLNSDHTAHQATVARSTAASQLAAPQAAFDPQRAQIKHTSDARAARDGVQVAQDRARTMSAGDQQRTDVSHTLEKAGESVRE